MSKSYRIGVISDTHNRYVEQLTLLLEGIDELWHLGDVCNPETLERVTGLCPRFHAVLGNNDAGLRLPMTLSLERFGERFHLIHIPPRVVPDDCDWLLCGHTHVPKDYSVGERQVHWFNPGSAGLANKGAPLSLGLLVKEGEEPFRSEIVPLAEKRF